MPDDSEEPADYRETLKEMVKEGATVSVIALGTEKSADAGLLREIAELGRGRIFFCDRPGDIPSIFAQETVSVARAAFIRERTLLRGTAGWLQIAAGQPEWPPAVDGYNLCYLRNGATAACVTEDGNAAPLVSFWNRGTGRTAAVTFAMGGELGKNIQQWDGYGDLIQTLARWLNRKNPPQGYSVRADTAGDRLRIRLYYSEENIPAPGGTHAGNIPGTLRKRKLLYTKRYLGTPAAGNIPVQLSPPARSHGAGRGPHRRQRYPLRPCQPAGGPGMGHAA